MRNGQRDSDNTVLKTKMKVSIKQIRGGAVHNFSHEADISTLSVREFKEQISSKANLGADSIRLVCEGRVLEDNFQMSHYNITEENTIHCLEYNNASRNVSSAAQVLNPNAMTEQEQQMQALMNNPLMDSLMSNPELMQNMMRMNPQVYFLIELLFWVELICYRDLHFSWVENVTVTVMIFSF